MSCFQLDGSSNTFLHTAVASAFGAGAVSVLYAKKQLSDLNRHSSELEISAVGNLHNVATYGNGSSIYLGTNWASPQTPASGVLEGNIGNWEWRFVVGNGTSLQAWTKSGGSWVAFSGGPLTITASNIVEMMFGGNDHDESMHCLLEGIRVWSAVKSTANMDAEIVSPLAVDTTNLFLSKTAMGAANLSAALASGTGSMTASGNVSIVLDNPNTYSVSGNSFAGLILPRMNGTFSNMNGWMQ